MLSRLLLALSLLLAPAAPAQALLEPAPAAQVVAQLVARIFEQTHYNHRPIDEALSRQWLRDYLDYYDYNHMFLEKSDVDEFEARYGQRLGELVREGNLAPAYEIFERFLQRAQERKALVDKLTASTVTFTADESLVVNRHKLPWPADGREAAELWRLRVKFELLQERLGSAKPEDQVKTVRTRYERLLRSFKEFDANDVLQAYLSALARAYDPHSDYLAAPSAENFNISMKLSLVGIGAVLRSEDGYAKIVSLVPGGPAAKDGRLKPNDKIEAVAQGDGPFLDAVGLKLDRLVQLIRGDKGTTVRLKVIPADAADPSKQAIISLVRDEIKLTDQEARAKVIAVPQAGGKSARVGVINLPSFYADLKGAGDAKSTTRDVQTLVAKLEADGIDGLILDLRHNGGGSLSEAVALTRVFINDGPVVQVKDTRGFTRVLRTPSLESGGSYAGPMLVLTSHASASASEILAAALQDYGRAVVAGGKSTFGKGTVQSVVELDQYLPTAMSAYKPGSLKLTIQKFYRISGGSTQNRGVIPDIRLPAVADSMDVTETSLKNALPYDEVAPVRHARLDTVTPVLSGLVKASQERVAASPEFAYIREDIERYKKQQSDKTVSLNEAKRRAEKKADEDRLKKRKAERAARKSPKFPETEISLAAAEGRPEPAVSSSTGAKTGAAPGEDDEDKDPSAPDSYLDEAVRIVADWIALLPRRGQAASRPKAESDESLVP
jgi:carboxyl-terminal processing protease